MKTLRKLASEYADKNFSSEPLKHDVAYHSFCDGFNEAMRILMSIGNQLELDKRVTRFNYIDPQS